MHVLACLLLDHLDDVLQGHDAHHLHVGVHDGDGADPVLLSEAGDLLLVGAGADDGDLLAHEVADLFVGLVEHEPREGADSLEVVVLVGDVDEVDRVGVDGTLDLLDHLARRGVGGHGHEVPGHAAARGVRRILAQVLDVRLLVRVHLEQHLLLLVVRQVVDDVGDRVVGHLVDDGAELVLADLVDELDLRIVGHRRQRLGRDLGVEHLEDADALVEVEVVEIQGEVDRMDRCQEGPDLVAVHPFLLQQLRERLILFGHYRILCRSRVTVNARWRDSRWARSAGAI